MVMMTTFEQSVARYYVAYAREMVNTMSARVSVPRGRLALAHGMTFFVGGSGQHEAWVLSLVVILKTITFYKFLLVCFHFTIFHILATFYINAFERRPHDLRETIKGI